MNEERNTNEGACRACWQNCGVQADAEMLDIDKMEDAIVPLDEQTTRIRELITRFEACYHEADKQAELIAGLSEPDAARRNRANGRRSEKRSWKIAYSYFHAGAKIRLFGA